MWWPHRAISLLEEREREGERGGKAQDNTEAANASAEPARENTRSAEDLAVYRSLPAWSRFQTCASEICQVSKGEPTLSRFGHFSGRDNPNGSDNGDHRTLQSCAAGSGVTVTSSPFPLLEGCLTESNDEYSSDTGLVVSGGVEGGNSTMVRPYLRTNALYCLRRFPASPVVAWWRKYIALLHPTACWIVGYATLDGIPNPPRRVSCNAVHPWIRMNLASRQYRLSSTRGDILACLVL